MRTNCRVYTNYEDGVIMRYVKENPDNFTRAFRLAAAHLNRTVRGIEQHYYNSLYKKPYWKNIPQPTTTKPKEEKEKIKFTISLGKFCISITER